MNSRILSDITREQEEELTSILLNSSLYQEMDQEDKRKLLNYLVTSYFHVLPGNNSRALPAAIPYGPAI